VTARSIFDPVIDQGIFDANFFEGRLLTADALRDAQQAQTGRQKLLATAVGAGVAQGLRVRLEPDLTAGLLQTVTIEKGLALDGEGNLLRLQQDLTADVVPPTQIPEAPATLFARCADAATPQPTVPVGVGLWILVMSPASGYRGRAEKSGLGSEGKIIGCGSRWAVDGVRFRLEPLRPESMVSAGSDVRAQIVSLLQDTGTPASRSLLRNLVAHLCLGDPQPAFAADPFARAAGASAVLDHGVLDDLRAVGRLGGCDVPLALLLWNEGGVAFLDLWSVRRRPVPAPRSVDWPSLAAARESAEAEARFLQFQDHLQDLWSSEGAPVTAKAADLFVRLPPIGFLPTAETAGQAGFAPDAFFAGLTTRGPIFVEGARLKLLFRAAAAAPPIDTSSAELVWCYQVRENAWAIDSSTAPPQGYRLFVNGHVPFLGDPRFDAARWSYANYALAR